MKHMKPDSPHARGSGGYSLIELLVVLAIIAGVVIVVVSRGQSARETEGANQLITDIGLIADKIRSIYGQASSGYNGLSNSTIYPALPNHLQGPGTSIRNPWGSNNTTVSSANGGADFTISTSQVPQKACVDAGANLFGQYRQVTINGTTITNPGDLAGACSNPQNNTLVIQDS